MKIQPSVLIRLPRRRARPSLRWYRDREGPPAPSGYFFFLGWVGGFVTRGSGMKVTVYISRAVR